MVSRRQYMLNLRILFLQRAGGESWVKLAFLCDFGIFLYVNLQKVLFFRSCVRS